MSDQPVTALSLLSERWSSASALENESDRAVALIAAAFLDDALEAVLRAALVDDHAVIQSLFGADRPLGTFSARIKMTYALGIKERCMTLRTPLIIPGHILSDFSDPRVRYIESTQWFLNVLSAQERELKRPPVWPDNRF